MGELKVLFLEIFIHCLNNGTCNHAVAYLWQGIARHRPYLTFIMSTQPVVLG